MCVSLNRVRKYVLMVCVCVSIYLCVHICVCDIGEQLESELSVIKLLMFP